MITLRDLFGFATPHIARPVKQRRATRRPAAQPAPDADLLQIFYEEYRELRPRAPFPPMHISYYPFVQLNNGIRLREGELYVRLSDTLEGAPEPVLRALAHILLAKLYRKPIAAQANKDYNRYVHSEAVSKQAERVRRVRGTKRGLGPAGKVYNLEEIFEQLNREYFHGLMARPALLWSEHKARRLLGHYDAAHNTIMVSSILDQGKVPRYVVEYLVYHEMLHLVHPVKVRGGRRCVHPKAFQLDEARFLRLSDAKHYLKQSLE